MEITIILITLMIMIIIYKLKAQQYTKEGIPIIGNIPYLGCAIELRNKGGKFLAQMRKKHGDIFALRLAGKKLFFVFNENFYSSFYKGSESEMGFYEGIRDDNSAFHFDTILGKRINENNEEKKEVSVLPPIRNFLQENSSNFSHIFLHPHFAYFFYYSKQQQGIKEEEEGEGGKKEYKMEVMRLAMDLAIGLGAATLSNFEIASDPIFLSSSLLFAKSSLLILSKPKILAKKERENCERARNKMREIIDQYLIKEYSNRGNENVPKKEKVVKEFPDYLFEHSYESTNRPFGVDESGYSIVAMIFATMGNTSSTITNTLIDILVHPHIQKRVLSEIEQQLKSENRNLNPQNGELKIPKDKYFQDYYISQGMIDGMEFLDQCITESIRLKAPPVNIRKIQSPLYSDQGKVLIPKNSFVCTSPWVRHREEEIYEDADLYNPDRFAKGNKQKRFSFLTFGQGRHFCLGKHFAHSIIKLTITILLLYFDLKLINDETSARIKSDDQKISWFGFGVLKPKNNIYLSFTPKF